jgi:acetylglutamate kinase
VKLLVKIGGTLLDEAATRESLACQIASLALEAPLVVVHGGGRQMTRYLTERGVESRFVNGLRVTTPEVLEAVIEVVAGAVNRELTAALNRAGARAVGISGLDGRLVEAEQMDPALGSVGRVTHADGTLLTALTGAGFLPVVACVAGDRAARAYNVNADQLAVACAGAFAAELLVFLTDVAGVLDQDRQLVPDLTPDGCEALIAGGIAAGGMRAKLRAAQDALTLGVPEVRIAPGSARDVLPRILAGHDLGTRVAAEVRAR